MEKIDGSVFRNEQNNHEREFLKLRIWVMAELVKKFPNEGIEERDSFCVGDITVELTADTEAWTAIKRSGKVHARISCYKLYPRYNRDAGTFEIRDMPLLEKIVKKIKDLQIRVVAYGEKSKEKYRLQNENLRKQEEELPELTQLKHVQEKWILRVHRNQENGEYAVKLDDTFSLSQVKRLLNFFIEDKYRAT